MNENDYDIELERDINSIREWITNKMHFNKKTEVSLFESTIRVLGGLLSAYNLTNENIYLTSAKELGNKLMYAFDTATGIPYASIDFTNNKGFNPSWSRSATSTSEVHSQIKPHLVYIHYQTLAASVKHHLHRCYKELVYHICAPIPNDKSNICAPIPNDKYLNKINAQYLLMRKMNMVKLLVNKMKMMHHK